MRASGTVLSLVLGGSGRDVFTIRRGREGCRHLTQLCTVRGSRRCAVGGLLLTRQYTGVFSRGRGGKRAGCLSVITGQVACGPGGSKGG